MAKHYSLGAMRSGHTLAVSTCIFLASGLAQADPVPSLDLRGFRPPTAHDSSLYLEPTSTPGSGNWNAGAWFSYANDLVTLENSRGEQVAVPVEHQLSLDYVASLGVGERLAVGAVLPTVLYQTGDDTSQLIGSSELPRTALGDLGFNAKATLVPTDELGGFGLAALASVTAPTGDPRSYVGDGAVTGELRLLAELRLIAVNLQGTAGARVRAEEDRFVGEEFGHELPWGVGVNVKPQAFGLDDEGRWSWTVETRGAVAITPELASSPQSPVAAGLSARYTVGDFSTIAGAELPLNAAVGNPAVRAVLGLSWAPRFYDGDGDGIADEDDECMELAEDRDGFADSDGCPDFDNDDDAVPDEEDQCPTEQEDLDEFQDDDGCLDPDNDGDGIIDPQDACPNEAGPASADPKTHGCTLKDMDGDGIVGEADRCPTAAEDKDGFQDGDGCPDLDNDGDGVPDEDDSCPLKKGEERSDPKLNGCPSPDQDGDTFDDDADKCPDKPEDFDGDGDDDGCPDDDADKPAYQQAKPLITVAQQDDEQRLRWRVAPAFVPKEGSFELDAKTVPTVRAIAHLLNQHPDWVALVGVRPKARSPEAQQEALGKSFAVVHALRTFTHRDASAESIGWSAVENLPGARAAGIGVLLLTPQAEPTPVEKKPAAPSKKQP